MKISTSNRVVVAALCASASFVTAAGLKADSLYFPNQPNNEGDNTLEDIDFTSSIIQTGSSGALAGKKYWVLDLATYNGNKQCFTLVTNGPAGGDSRIWVYDSTINDYRSLNDDANGTWYSQANIWIDPPSNGGRYVSPVISAYSAAYNGMQFFVQIIKRNSATTEAACTSGSTYKSTGSGTAFVNAT